jgi:hypothetical protein
MPWDDLYYPPAMERLPLRVRRKAIEIANALLAEGHEEGLRDPRRHRSCEGVGAAMWNRSDLRRQSQPP